MKSVVKILVNIFCVFAGAFGKSFAQNYRSLVLGLSDTWRFFFSVEPIFIPVSLSFRLISVRRWWLACWINRIPARNASLFFRFFSYTVFFMMNNKNQRKETKTQRRICWRLDTRRVVRVTRLIISIIIIIISLVSLSHLSVRCMRLSNNRFWTKASEIVIKPNKKRGTKSWKPYNNNHIKPKGISKL